MDSDSWADGLVRGLFIGSASTLLICSPLMCKPDPPPPKPPRKPVDIGKAAEDGAEHVGRGGARGIVRGIREGLKSE